MPLRRLAGLPRMSSAPYSERRAGTRRSRTVIVRDVPAVSVNFEALTRTSPSVRLRLAATTPLLDCRHGRARTVTRSLRVDEFVIVTLPLAPARAVASRRLGDTESPPAADAVSAATAAVASAAPRTARLRNIKRLLGDGSRSIRGHGDQDGRARRDPRAGAPAQADRGPRWPPDA